MQMLHVLAAVALAASLSVASAQLDVPLPNPSFESPVVTTAGSASAVASWSAGSAYVPLSAEFGSIPNGRQLLRLAQGQSSSITVTQVRPLPPVFFFFFFSGGRGKRERLSTGRRFPFKPCPFFGNIRPQFPRLWLLTCSTPSR